MPTLNRMRRGEAVEPVSTIRLVEMVGASQAARLLGTSTTLLHNARNEKLVSKVVEVAAEALVQKLTVPEQPARVEPVKTELFLLAVTPDQREMVERVAKMLHADLLAA